MSQKKGFRFRAFISVLTGFSFLGLTLTGIILYITPPGRIANWTNWSIWGLDKHQWGALHICFSAMCIIASVIHVWINRKPLVGYFISKIKEASGFRFEWVAALILCGIVTAGALTPFAPFRSLLELNNRIKQSWAAPKQTPPIPHAEILTIAELAQKADLDVEDILLNLLSKNIAAQPEDIFGDVAAVHQMSPNQLYDIATGQAPQPGQNRQRGGGGGARGGGGSGGGGHGGGGGFGQQTLRTACDDLGIDLQAAINTLKLAGIECTPDQRIREIADNNNTHPSQVRQTLESITK